jgi:hypothetical protein
LGVRCDFTPAQPLAFPRICFERSPVSGRDRAFGRVSAGSRTARDAFSADECGDRSIILGLRHDQYPSRSDFRRASQKLGTHLEIPTKILIQVEVMTGSAPLSGEHFLPVAESIAGQGGRLKKFREPLSKKI